MYSNWTYCFFQNWNIITLSSRSLYVMFIEIVFFLILLLAYFLQEWYIYFCDMFSNHVFNLCQPETRCSWKGYHLKRCILRQEVPEKDTIWKDILLKQEVPEKDTIYIKSCPPEPGNSWKNTICKHVSLKFAPPWNRFCLWSCCAVKYYKSSKT